MIRSTKLITISSYVSMFFLGVGAAVIGAAARNIGLTPYQIGLLVSIQSLGIMLSVVISGALSDSYEKPRILFIGSIVLAISFFTFYLKTSFLLNLTIMFFIGVGIGAYQGVADAMLLEIHKERESLYINLNHFFVIFGCLMITLYLLVLQMSWRNSMTQSAIAVLLLAIFFGFTELKNEKKVVEKLSDRLRFLMNQKIILILFFVTICAAGFEMGIIGIMTTFLMELRNFSQVTSKFGLLIFLSGIALGRLFVAFLIKKDQIFLFIILLFGLSTLFISGVYFMHAKVSICVLIFFSGITVSALFPLVITLAGIIYKDMAGTALGIIKLAVPIGGILIPFILSIISRYTSLKISLLLFPMIPLVSFITLLLNRKEFKPFMPQDR